MKIKNFKEFSLTTLSGVVVLVAGTWIKSRIRSKDRAEELKYKEKELNLRNQKVIELKKQMKALDNQTSVEEEVKISGTQSFQQMSSRPMADKSGWLVPWYARKGQISGCVAGADTGKTILMIDCALAAAKGETPTFLPEGAPKADMMDVVFYLLEERAGELVDRYGDGTVFPANIGWITKGDISSPTFDGLIADVTKRAEGFKRDTAVFLDPLSKFPNWDLAKFLSAIEDVQNDCAKRGVVVSFLFSAHTEETKPWKPLTPDMVRGGDVVIQQVGALFALRRERSGNGYRFIQTLKVPKGEVEKGVVDVIRFEGRKEDQPGSYTHLVHHSQKKESEALPLKPKAEKEEETASEKPVKRGKLAGKYEEIRELRYVQNISVEKIANEYGVSKQAIYDILKEKC